LNSRNSERQSALDHAFDIDLDTDAEHYARADVPSIYRRAARHDPTTRNPVIVIPGILGSKLIATSASRQVWGDLRKDAAKPVFANEARLVGLPMKIDVPLDQLRGEAETDGTLDEIKGKFAGMPIRKRVYGDILSAMGVTAAGRGSKHTPEYDGRGFATAFEFDYDWRRSLDESAIRLQRFIRQATRFIQAQRGNHAPVRFDFVVHSMGGLVLRYFLRYGAQLLPYDGAPPRLTWEGANIVDKVVVVATPNAGSVFALERLVSGLPATAIHPRYDPMVIGTMPALYQLLPRSRHRPFRRVDENTIPDLFDVGLWHDMGWGLANQLKETELAKMIPGVDSDAERRDIGLDHVEKCLRNAYAFHNALDTPAPNRPDHLRAHLIVGDSVLTPVRAGASPGDDTLKYERSAPGDKTVLRSSAILDERLDGHWSPQLRSPLKWHSVTFVPCDHLTITQDPIVIDNVLYHLLEEPRD
jgi:hypothetical protein